MLKNKLFHLLSLSTLIVFVLSAVLTVPALADGGSTPPPTAPSSGGRTSNKGSPLSQVPSGTKVVVVDASGNKLPLGSQAAQDIVNNGDPIWCPSTVSSPVAGMSGCSPLIYDTSGLAFLTNAVESGTWHPTATNSTIWIEDTSDSTGTQIILNSGVVGAVGNFTLTFKGGWTGVGGSISSTTPSTINNAGFSIAWNNSVTMSNITDNGAPGHEDGIYIATPKNITLTNMQANNGDDYGAYLVNSYGNGTVTITNSTFNNNNQVYDAWGMVVLSSGAITLKGVTVDNNYYAGGAKLNNCNWTGSVCNTSAHSAVTITSSDFSGNNHSTNPGLWVDSNGAIKLTDVTASNNGAVSTGAGAVLNNCNSNTSVCTTSGQSVTLSGTNIFDGSTGGGLYVYSGGVISSGALYANYNGGTGATLDTCNWNGSSCTGTLQPVTLTGTSSFSDNTYDGLDIFSKGAISVNNLSAVRNGTTGVWLDNEYSSTTYSPVKITGTNTFAFNLYSGLFILSDGAISMNNLSVDNNGSVGPYDGLLAINSGASKAQAITLTGTNTFNQNYLNGAEFQASGAVSLSNVTADLNSGSSGIGPYGDGIFIRNDYLGPESVTLSGTNEMSLNYKDGLTVQSLGAITLNNLTANFNSHGYGADLYYNSADVTGAVTLKGTNTFDYNHVSGLLVNANGKVALNNLTADFNSIAYGAEIYNYYGITPQSVTLTGTNTFNYNHVDGLVVESYGAITASNLTAESNNTGYGAVLDNCYNLGGCFNSHVEPVTLTGINTFSFNYTDGLWVESTGAITASNLTAESNSHGDGVLLDNCDVWLVACSNLHVATITLSGINAFNSNHLDGLVVTATGAITASNLHATYNGTSSGFDGVSLNNCASNGSNCTGSANVTVSGTNLLDYNAYGDGLSIVSTGTVTTSNLTAVGNGASSNYDDVYINNISAPTPKNVSLNGLNTFNGSGYDGVEVYSHGAISASNITAEDNWNEGGYLKNQYLGSSGGITITGTNVFLYNAGNNNYDGFDLYSNGAESITHVTADFNGEAGMYFSTTGKVTVTCGAFIGNGTNMHIYDYGWQTDNTFAPSSITLIGTDYAVNWAGDWDTLGATSTTFTPRTCTLP